MFFVALEMPKFVPMPVIVLSSLTLVLTTLYQWGWVAKYLDSAQVPLASTLVVISELDRTCIHYPIAWLAVCGAKRFYSVNLRRKILVAKKG